MIGDIGEHQKEDILRLKKTQMKETVTWEAAHFCEPFPL